MFKMNKWAWVGVGGGVFGFLVAIITTLAVGGKEGIYITGGMLVIFGGVFYLIYRLLIGPMMNVARLQKTGLPGKAIITAVNDTGVTINNSPQVKLTLEVKNSFGQRYTTTCRTLVSRINPFVYQPGMEVPVKIDPKNEKNVVLDYDDKNKPSSNQPGSSSYNSAGIVNLTDELQKMQQENDALKITGRSARAIIKNYTWLGTYVNGNNPYVEIEVEVLPDTSPAFSGKTKGVIAEASVVKFQPGKEIYVKYDPYDNSKIVIDHS